MKYNKAIIRRPLVGDSFLIDDLINFHVVRWCFIHKTQNLNLVCNLLRNKRTFNV